MPKKPKPRLRHLPDADPNTAYCSEAPDGTIRYTLWPVLDDLPSFPPKQRPPFPCRVIYSSEGLDCLAPSCRSEELGRGCWSLVGGLAVEANDLGAGEDQDEGVDDHFQWLAAEPKRSPRGN